MTTLATASASGTATARTACAHCEQPIPFGRNDDYCCRGCRAVATLIHAASLDRYYELRRGPGLPIAETTDAPRDRKWLEPITTSLATSEGIVPVAIDLQGVHCSACVWLIETVFERERAGGTIEVNPALGRAELRVDRAFPLEHFVGEIESFGYRVGPSDPNAEAPLSDGLLLRAGIALALAGNAMMLSAAIHLGLRSGATYEWANNLSFGASTIAMAIGAPIFWRSAWAGLRRGILHLDFPIALGMSIAYAGSVWSYFARFDANYVDTLTAFVALMLLGRWLQTRVVERNRREMLRDPGLEGLLCRRMANERAELVPCSRVEPGDVLLVAPGDLVPVRATLLDVDAAFSFDWIDGESRPRTLRVDDSIPSGALLSSESAVRVRAEEAFQSSTVSSLLRDVRADDLAERTLAGLPKNVGGAYVVFVLVASALSGILAYLRTGSLVDALEVTTAALVVTCPCAFGIAVPLAYEITQTRLRRLGVFVRRPSLFERILRVRRVIFDKTGTVTTGRLAIADEASVARLEPRVRDLLYTLAARSNHPKSRALALALENAGELRPVLSATVREIRGHGLELERRGSVHRLGEPSWALGNTRESTDDGDADLVYSVDGSLRASFTTEEQLRPEAADEVRRLESEGFEVFLLSGDRKDRCEEVARELGIEERNVVASSRPEDKERFVLAHDPASTLMIGDGLNDARALASAGCSGTPSIERPFTASRCDFYFVSPGLEPVSHVLHAARRLAQIVRTDLAIAFVYNVAAVALCVAGLMKPWLAAILMPGSSLGTIAFTAWFLTRGGRRWTS